MIQIMQHDEQLLGIIIIKVNFFRDNQFKIEWWDDKSFIDTYNDNLDKVSA